MNTSRSSGIGRPTKRAIRMVVKYPNQPLVIGIGLRITVAQNGADRTFELIQVDRLLDE